VPTLIGGEGFRRTSNVSRDMNEQQKPRDADAGHGSDDGAPGHEQRADRPLPRVETRRRILYTAPALIGSFLLASRAEAANSCNPHVDCQPLLCNPYAPQ
jgi:hypothetical protein